METSCSKREDKIENENNKRKEEGKIGLEKVGAKYVN